MGNTGKISYQIMAEAGEEEVYEPGRAKGSDEGVSSWTSMSST
jgi:hypothetical protein